MNLQYIPSSRVPQAILVYYEDQRIGEILFLPEPLIVNGTPFPIVATLYLNGALILAGYTVQAVQNLEYYFQLYRANAMNV